MKVEIPLLVNGLAVNACFYQDTINNLLLPLLMKLNQLQKEKQRRIIVFLVAPPAVGKSTLAQFLEELAVAQKMDSEIQAIGMDGFHYAQAYLQSHYIDCDDRSIRLSEIKGSPESFDVDQLLDTIQRMKQNDIDWPVYDRRIHDVGSETITIQGDVILIEGNWLLLNEGKWKQVSKECDYSIFISATERRLKKRLIDRKIKGGMSYDEAEAFYNTSDRKNIQRVMQGTQDADEHWILTECNDYKKEGKKNE